MKDRFALGALLFLALMPGALRAQAIYKCVIKGKAASYQSEPCAANAKVASIREYQPEPVPTYQQVQARRAREMQGRQESAYLSRIAGTDGRSSGVASGHVLPVGGSACESAKAARDAYEKQAGLARTFNGLRIFNDGFIEHAISQAAPCSRCSATLTITPRQHDRLCVSFSASQTPTGPKAG